MLRCCYLNAIFSHLTLRQVNPHLFHILLCQESRKGHQVAYLQTPNLTVWLSELIAGKNAVPIKPNYNKVLQQNHLALIFISELEILNCDFNRLFENPRIFLVFIHLTCLKQGLLIM